MSVLLLGGTREARDMAARLLEAGVPALTSLAGGVADPLLPPGPVRVGGFGGVAGLVDYLRHSDIQAVVDATHPFAAQITANAADACAQVGVPLLRLSRPGWSKRPDASTWHWVDTPADAREQAEKLGRRAFLSVGRQSLGEFTKWTDRYVLVRVVDPPSFEVPDTWEVYRARGPFSIDAERRLLTTRRIDVLVTKDSGGDLTAAKLDAAAELRVAVVIVRRPPQPVGVDVVTSVSEAISWVRRQPFSRSTT